MRQHELKVVPPYFDTLLDGSKTFEVRRNDRAYQAGREGGVLWLREYDTGHTDMHSDDPSCCLLRGIKRRITFVFTGDDRFDDGLLPGFVVLGLAPLDPS